MTNALAGFTHILNPLFGKILRSTFLPVSHYRILPLQFTFFNTKAGHMPLITIYLILAASPGKNPQKEALTCLNLFATDIASLSVIFTTLLEPQVLAEIFPDYRATHGSHPPSVRPFLLTKMPGPTARLPFSKAGETSLTQHILQWPTGNSITPKKSWHDKIAESLAI